MYLKIHIIIKNKWIKIHIKANVEKNEKTNNSTKRLNFKNYWNKN